MGPSLAAIALTSGWLPVVVDAAAAALLVVVLIRRPRRAPLVATALAGMLGVGVGLVLCWLLGDQLDLFDVSLSPSSRAWVGATFGGVGVAVAALTRPGRGHRIVGALTIPVVLLAGALGVNADFGQYPTIGSLAGRAVAAPVPAAVLTLQRAGAQRADSTGAEATAAVALWKEIADGRLPATGLRAHGLVGTVTIPAPVSHFPARPAYVYLPPAALTAHPVALPVMVLLAGQPGGPSNIVQSGKLAEILDAFAASHDGLAPIVVIPDQLAAPQANPMCVDSALGNSETYLTVDVPRWIRTHLTVQTSQAAWAIGGFSQGGTCSIQLGAGHPELFGAIVDISGQIAPQNGDLRQTIDRGFGGSSTAYAAALPEHLLAMHGPYPDTVAVFGSGQFDSKYGPRAIEMAAAARAAGMRVTRVISPGTAHDWHTVQWVLRTALGPIYRQLGLVAP